MPDRVSALSPTFTSAEPFDVAKNRRRSETKRRANRARFSWKFCRVDISVRGCSTHGICRPAVSGNPHIRLKHCTAWPLAPLTILSIALITMMRPVRLSILPAMSMKFVPTNILGIGQTIVAQQTDKRLLAVSTAENLCRIDPPQPFDSAQRINRGNDSAIYRNQMRRELNHDLFSGQDRQLLLDLGKMSMFRHAIGRMLSLHSAKR